jgi:virulence-associated protein VagC
MKHINSIQRSNIQQPQTMQVVATPVSGDGCSEPDVGKTWDSFFQLGMVASEDFMIERDSQQLTERPPL